MGCPPCRPPGLAVTLEFRPGQWPEVTLLSVLTSTCCKEPHPGKGHREVHGMQSSRAPQPAPRLQGCSPGEVMALQVRRGRVTQTSEVMGDARPPGRPKSHFSSLLTANQKRGHRSGSHSAQWLPGEAGYTLLKSNHPASSCQPGASLSLHKMWREPLKEAKGQSSKHAKKNGVTRSPAGLAMSPTGLRGWIQVPSDPTRSFSAGINNPDTVQPQLQRAVKPVHFLPDRRSTKTIGNVTFECIPNSLSVQASSPQIHVLCSTASHRGLLRIL